MSKIILGNKIKLYRNIHGKKFVNKMNEDELKGNLDFLDPIIQKQGYKKTEIESASSLKKLEYIEEGRFSKNFVDGKNIGFYEKEDFPDILVNSEEHIEISKF